MSTKEVGCQGERTQKLADRATMKSRSTMLILRGGRLHIHKAASRPSRKMVEGPPADLGLGTTVPRTKSILGERYSTDSIYLLRGG